MINEWKLNVADHARDAPKLLSPRHVQWHYPSSSNYWEDDAFVPRDVAPVRQHWSYVCLAQTRDVKREPQREPRLTTILSTHQHACYKVNYSDPLLTAADRKPYPRDTDKPSTGYLAKLRAACTQTKGFFVPSYFFLTYSNELWAFMLFISFIFFKLKTKLLSREVQFIKFA